MLLPNQYFYNDAGELTGGYKFFEENGIVYQRHLDAKKHITGPSAHHSSQSLAGTVPLRGDTTAVADNAFYGCSGITRIVLPDGVKYIHELAFDSCTALEEVVLPADALLEGDVFCGCGALRRLVLTGTTNHTVLCSCLKGNLTGQQLGQLTVCGLAGSIVEQAARSPGCAFAAL